jgi:hypothetical protein
VRSYCFQQHFVFKKLSLNKTLELQMEDFKSSVTSKSFEDTKLTIAKQLTGNSCLLASQVRKIIKCLILKQPD